MKPFDTPILFLIYNRPDTTSKVFERIKTIKPNKLFVAADGPNKSKSKDEILCKQAREIVIENIDWPCNVKTLFREYNLGCGKAVSEAITWFFDNVEQGIIIEDDILPDVSFFTFAENLLNYYKNDNRVMMISGYNYAGEWKSTKQDYFFAYLGSIWGWATWKRAWNFYNYNPDFVTNTLIFDQFLTTYFEGTEIKRRKKLYLDLYNGKIDTWDYQWTIARLLQNGLAIIPSKNLVENIGFSHNATHTIQKPNWIKQRVYSLSKFKYQKYVFCDRSYDKFYNTMISDDFSKFNFFRIITQKIINKLKRITKIKHVFKDFL